MSLVDQHGRMMGGGRPRQFKDLNRDEKLSVLWEMLNDTQYRMAVQARELSKILQLTAELLENGTPRNSEGKVDEMALAQAVKRRCWAVADAKKPGMNPGELHAAVMASDLGVRISLMVDAIQREEKLC